MINFLPSCLISYYLSSTARRPRYSQSCNLPRSSRLRLSIDYQNVKQFFVRLRLSLISYIRMTIFVWKEASVVEWLWCKACNLVVWVQAIHPATHWICSLVCPALSLLVRLRPVTIFARCLFTMFVFN